MAEHDPVSEADALEQSLRPVDDPELLDEEEGDPEIGVDVPEADAMEQGRSRAVPAAVATRPIPADAPEDDVIEQRLPAGDDDDEDEHR